jgi:RNA recognition motif-containing protein
LTQEHKYHSKIEENKEDLLARPPHGTEVFVGGISKEVTEAELRELCASCGELFEVHTNLSFLLNASVIMSIQNQQRQ